MEEQTDREVLGQYIPLHYHVSMLRDRHRMSAFAAAIDQAVPAGGRVVDLGGGTGVLSFLAAQKATRAWCVERNPQLVEACRRLLDLNGCRDRVTVVEQDACDFTPPEPVDVVVCEMLHSAMLVEKQIAVIEAFKRNYSEAFPDRPLPRFVPQVFVLSVQPVQQSFDYHGFRAPLPTFFDPNGPLEGTQVLSAPLVYQMSHYDQPLPLKFSAQLEFEVQEAGTCNGLRFLTRNVLGVFPRQVVEWHSHHLVLPLAASVEVQPGDRLGMAFSYPAGGRLQALQDQVRAWRL